MVGCRFVETKRWLDFVTPGSQAAEDSFFGWEAAFEGLECGYSYYSAGSEHSAFLLTISCTIF